MSRMLPQFTLSGMMSQAPAVRVHIAVTTSSLLEPLLREAAQSEIMPRFHHAEACVKPDGSLVTEADLAVQRVLAERLADRWPQVPLLGEEMDAETQGRLVGAGRFWCLDPLDGTTNFSSGLPYFCVSIALVDDGRLTAGAVYDPVRDECFRADAGAGAWVNGRPLRLAPSTPALRESVAIVDLKRLPPELVARLAHASPYRSQRNFGAIALEWCWLAAGRADLYLHGAQKLWDYAAGSLIFAEAGGVCRLYEGFGGAPLGGLTLAPKFAVAAAGAELFHKWEGWVHGH